MIAEEKYSYIEYTTYEDDGGYTRLDTILLTQCGITKEFGYINRTDIFDQMMCEVDTNTVVFVKDLPLLYQILYKELFPRIDRTKKHYFYEKYRPLYFYIDNVFFKDVSSLKLKTYEELRDFVSQYNSIKKVPNTLAGIVRHDLAPIMRSAWRGNIEIANNEKYLDVVDKAYSGGDMGHSFLIDYIEEEMISFDINSSYPTLLYYYEFPVGKWSRYSGKMYDYYSKKGYLNKDYLITVKFKNIESNGINPSIFYHWVSSEINAVVKDQRVISADEITVTCTSMDYDAISRWYRYSTIEILDFYTNSKWSVLPDEVRQKIKEYYIDKELSKDPIKKRKLNICYGVFASGSPSNTHWEFDDNEYNPEEIVNVFPFNIACFCTAYARQRLNNVLYDLRRYAKYWDTDCVKVVTDDLDLVYETIEKYNNEMKSLYDDDDDWELGLWKDEGIHNILLFGKKQYISDGKPKFSGVCTKGYENCDINTVFKNGIKTNIMTDNGLKIQYTDKIVNNARLFL